MYWGKKKKCGQVWELVSYSKVKNGKKKKLFKIYNLIVTIICIFCQNLLNQICLLSILKKSIFIKFIWLNDDNFR